MKQFKMKMTVEHDDGEVEHIGGISFQVTDVDPSVNDANIAIARERFFKVARGLVTEIMEGRQLRA